MNQIRDTIFISHSTPEDNEFTIWLASRLQLLGYTVWIDKNGLIGGEKFWENIDQVIRNKAIKILFIYSNNICQKDNNNLPIEGKLKDGVSKEYSLSESIAKQHNINDFIILLNIDGANYNLFIGADRLNQIPFFENWALGFNQLEKKLSKDNVPKLIREDNNEFYNWYQDKYLNSNRIEEKKELYYSNWWEINSLPEFFYIYQFFSEEQAKSIQEQYTDFPISKISNNISSFELFDKFQIKTNNNLVLISYTNRYKIKISDIFENQIQGEFPTNQDAENYLKQLLKRIFHIIMKNRHMFWYEMANKRLAYFYTPANLTKNKVQFEYPFRARSKNKKTKNLIGTYLDLGKWHFGVSVKPILSPIIGFSLKSHIVFTNDGFKVWKNKENEIDVEKIHSHRRSKGKMMFNEEWRDLLLAFLSGLKQDGIISIKLSSNFTLEMPSIMYHFWSDFGYYDPKDKTRHGLLSTYENEIDDEI